MISRRPAAECASIVKSMTRTMMHEQFYRSSYYNASSMGIYAGWVAFDDSFIAERASADERKDVVIILSGECFPGGRIPSEVNCKVDWLARLYEMEGDAFFSKLNGLFSGLLIDKRKNCAFLFNDRYGIERLYFHETKDALYFASEAKALLRVVPGLREFDCEGVAQYLAFGCTLAWRTLFRDVSVLPAASLWRFESGRCQKARYFMPAEWEGQEGLSEEDFDAEFEESFRRILPRYFEPESKVGISLTGGLDTRMIMASRPESNLEPICYTFGGENGETLDSLLAARIAGTCGLKHKILRIGPDFFRDFAACADRTLYATDGCFGVLGAHEIYLNRQARQLAPVRLTGVFGSELLRGMSTLKPMGLTRELLSPEIASQVECAEKELCSSVEHPVSFAAFREIPWNIFGSLAACKSQTVFRTPFLDNEIVALAFRAPERVRRSASSALRFVSVSNPDLAAIPTDKWLGGNASPPKRHFNRLISEVTFKLDYFYNEGMPHTLSWLSPVLDSLKAKTKIFGQHKYLHYRSWFRRKLADYLRERVRNAEGSKMTFFNVEFLRNMSREHIGGTRNYIREINAVLTLEGVERLLLQCRN